MAIIEDPPFFWDVLCDRCTEGELRIAMDDANSYSDVEQYIKATTAGRCRKNPTVHGRTFAPIV